MLNARVSSSSAYFSFSSKTFACGSVTMTRYIIVWYTDVFFTICALQRALYLENDREMEIAHTVAASAGDTEVSFLFVCSDIRKRSSLLHFHDPLCFWILYPSICVSSPSPCLISQLNVKFRFVDICLNEQYYLILQLAYFILFHGFCVI